MLSSHLTKTTRRCGKGTLLLNIRRGMKQIAMKLKFDWETFLFTFHPQRMAGHGQPRKMGDFLRSATTSVIHAFAVIEY